MCYLVVLSQTRPSPSRHPRTCVTWTSTRLTRARSCTTPCLPWSRTRGKPRTRLWLPCLYHTSVGNGLAACGVSSCRQTPFRSPTRKCPQAYSSLASGWPLQCGCCWSSSPSRDKCPPSSTKTFTHSAMWHRPRTALSRSCGRTPPSLTPAHSTTLSYSSSRGSIWS